ncbi:methylenetetrahydrofolate reductase [Undibacter mobilis]|uniref:Methylenetetrahydrofolate reductase n=2 Tax=Undibacter mobilis TaxID=2292256 RepID=A0A371B8W6_9BRAD|nr:methylenetetrahydrofolate reductase [Undibacter mobilis]
MHMKAASATVARRFSIETTRPKPAEIDAVAAAVPKGTEFYITAVPTQTEDELVAAAAHARSKGLEPVVHVAARRLPSVAMLQERLARLHAEADVRRLLVIGGDIDPVGPFADALAVIQKGKLRDAGIEKIGIAAYPEGHPAIPADRLAASLDEKIAAAVAQGLEVRLVSQFSFSPDDIVAWLKKLRATGITQPVSVGMVGPTSVPALLRFAKRCGVGTSLKGLMSGAASALIGNVGPDRIIEALNAEQATVGDVQPHYFTFGNLVATAEYGSAMAGKEIAAA